MGPEHIETDKGSIDALYYGEMLVVCNDKQLIDELVNAKVWEETKRDMAKVIIHQSLAADTDDQPPLSLAS